MGPIVFLLLPALSYASITINIKVATSKNQSAVTNNGEDGNIITDNERGAFNITDALLSAAIAKYSGRAPTNVYVKRPTPWGDLYKTYKWTEVRRETKVKQNIIHAVRTQEVTLAKGRYTNNSTINNTFLCNYTHQIENRISTEFVGTNASVNITYNVDLLSGFQPPIHLKYVSQLGNNTEVIDTRTIQPDSEVIFNLKPSQSATGFLNTTKVIMTVEMDYDSSLSGQLAVNYFPRHEGHHFWAYEVADVLKATGQASVRRGADLVTIQYYTDAKIVIVDDETGNVIATERAGY